jgi:hypothetical protein
LQRLGFAVGPVRVLAEPGRRSGVLGRPQPSPVVGDGGRSLAAGLGEGDRASNAPAAGRGVVRRGRAEGPEAATGPGVAAAGGRPRQQRHRRRLGGHAGRRRAVCPPLPVGALDAAAAALALALAGGLAILAARVRSASGAVGEAGGEAGGWAP